MLLSESFGWCKLENRNNCSIVCNFEISLINKSCLIAQFIVTETIWWYKGTLDWSHLTLTVTLVWNHNKAYIRPFHEQYGHVSSFNHSIQWKQEYNLVHCFVHYVLLVNTKLCWDYCSLQQVLIVDQSCSTLVYY